MNRNLIGALFVAGGLTLSCGVTSFAQSSPTDAVRAAIAACNQPALLAPSNLSGEAAREANAAYREATAALAEVTGEANFKIDELAAEGTAEEGGTAGLAAELAALQAETCRELTEIRAEYAAAIADVQAPANDTTEQDKAEVSKPAQPGAAKSEDDKSEVEKPEKDQNDQEKGETEKQHQDKQQSGEHD